MPRQLLAAALLLAATSCARSQYLGRVLTPDDLALMERANPLADLQVTVPHQLANESIKAVRARSRFLGALEGLGLGVAAVAAGGGLATSRRTRVPIP